MKKIPLKIVLSFCLVFFSGILTFNLHAQCISGTTISTFSGSNEAYTCPGDGNPDIIKFKPSSFATQYAFVVTDENNIILAAPPGNSVNFEGAGAGICRVWGLSFAGVLTIPTGEDLMTAELSDFCYELSANFVEVIRTDISALDGGMVAMPSGGTTRYTCPNDGNPDIIQFTNTGSSTGSYTYVITDENFNILGLPPGDSQDFEGAGTGVCLVWGLSYSGNIIAAPGDNASTTQLADGCFDLSDNYITVIRSNPEGGTVAMPNGNTTRSTCSGDDEDDIVMFETTSNSVANYAYVITDENNNILGLPPGNSANFEGVPQGICRVWGLSFTGTLTAQLGDNAASAALSNDCFELSDNFITIERTEVKGGNVSMPSGATTRYTCPGDGNADMVSFVNDSDAPNSYTYVITDEDFNILGLPPGNSQDFEGAGEGVCLVWGLSYTGNITAQAGDNAETTPLSDGCFDLSDNFITVIRSNPDGGTVAMPSGATTRYTCPGDGNPDMVSFVNNSGSAADYAYVITDEDFNILGLPPGDSQDFEGAGEGICLVWGLSYTGNITAQAGDNAATTPLSDGCFDLSDNFITVIRSNPDGGTVTMPSGATTRYTCPGDGNADIVSFVNNSGSAAVYTYVITDEDFNILGLPPGNSQDFEGAGEGVCLVWGLSYTGNITAQAGDNAATTPLSDGCFDLSDNFITVIRSNPDGGTVLTTEGESTVTICVGDGEDDIISFENNSGSGANYAYVITDDNNTILGLPPGNLQNFEGAGVGICRVWGLSYTGTITAQLGDNAAGMALSDDCFDLSDGFIEVIRKDDPETCDPTFNFSGSIANPSNTIDGTSLELFPNPASDYLNLRFDYSITENTPALVTISDARGKLLYQNNFSDNHLEIKLNKLPAGFYFLSLKAGNVSLNKKFIKK